MTLNRALLHYAYQQYKQADVITGEGKPGGGPGAGEGKEPLPMSQQAIFDTMDRNHDALQRVWSTSDQATAIYQEAMRRFLETRGLERGNNDTVRERATGKLLPFSPFQSEMEQEYPNESAAYRDWRYEVGDAYRREFVPLDKRYRELRNLLNTRDRQQDGQFNKPYKPSFWSPASSSKTPEKGRGEGKGLTPTPSSSPEVFSKIPAENVAGSSNNGKDIQPPEPTFLQKYQTPLLVGGGLAAAGLAGYGLQRYLTGKRKKEQRKQADVLTGEGKAVYGQPGEGKESPEKSIKARLLELEQQDDRLRHANDNNRTGVDQMRDYVWQQELERRGLSPGYHRASMGGPLLASDPGGGPSQELSPAESARVRGEVEAMLGPGLSSARWRIGGPEDARVDALRDRVRAQHDAQKDLQIPSARKVKPPPPPPSQGGRPENRVNDVIGLEGLGRIPGTGKGLPPPGPTFLQKYQTPLLVGGGLGAAALAGYGLHRYLTRQKKRDKEASHTKSAIPAWGGRTAYAQTPFGPGAEAGYSYGMGVLPLPHAGLRLGGRKFGVSAGIPYLGVDYGREPGFGVLRDAIPSVWGRLFNGATLPGEEGEDLSPDEQAALQAHLEQLRHHHREKKK